MSLKYIIIIIIINIINPQARIRSEGCGSCASLFVVFCHHNYACIDPKLKVATGSPQRRNNFYTCGFW